MTSQVCYTSLAIYSKNNIEQKAAELFDLLPTRTGMRNNTFSWIYSTQSEENAETVEQHIDLLKDKFILSTQKLVLLSGEGCDIRVWIYFGLADLNRTFVLSNDFLSWISLFGADISIDVWR